MVDLVQTESDGGALPSGGLRVRPAFGFELERAGSDFSLATVQRRRRSGLIALALAVIGLPAAALLARGPIVQFAPALRPILVSVCLPLRCQVPLPADADAWSVESNELREDPVGSRRFRFTATLRNRSPYVMAYPSLELNLTDVDGLAVERRILPPAKYLPIPRPVEEGLAANSEVTVRAEVLAADARSQGYRLVLFFP
jgi:hypothetical protein